MRVFKNKTRAKRAAVTNSLLMAAKDVLNDVADAVNDSTEKRLALMKEHDALLDAFAAERAQKERYRTAFLKLMNVPVTGKAWTGDDGYSEEN